MVSICISVVSTHQNELFKDLLDDLVGISDRFEVQVILRHNLPEPSIGVFEGLELREVWNDARAGFAANHNANFSLCQSDVFMVVNPDIRIENVEGLLLLAEAACAHGTVVGPQIINSAGELEDHIRAPLTIGSVLTRYLPFSQSEKEAVHPYFWIAGMFLVFPRELFGNLNGFDEKFFLYCEDADICARAALRDKPALVVENVKVTHDAQRASRRLNKYTLIHFKSLIVFFLSSVARRSLRLEPRRVSDCFIVHEIAQSKEVKK